MPLADVAAMAAYLPRDSATMLQVAPPTEYDLWADPRLGGGISTFLLAAIADAVIGANWQRSGKKNGKPKPIKRPKPQNPLVNNAGREIDDFKDWYANQAGGRAIGAEPEPNDD